MAMASAAWSRMCRRRITSSWRDIQVLCFGHNLVAEVGADEGGGVEVDGAAEEFGQFALEGKEAQANAGVRLEFDQDVEVAVGPEIVAQGGACLLYTSERTPAGRRPACG